MICEINWKLTCIVDRNWNWRYFCTENESCHEVTFTL